MSVILVGCHDVPGDRNVAGSPDAAGTLNTEGAAGVKDKIRTLNSGGIGEKLRELAIPVGDDLLMLPSGLDDDGCEMFRPHSVSGNPVKTATYFRQADGGFGTTRDPAICRVEMTSIGPDEDGCERYRAVPVNADLPLEHEVIYYKAADDSFSASKPVDSCG